MSRHVRVLRVTHVQPNQTDHHADDDGAASIKLSLFDTLFIALAPIQRLFFYDDDDGGDRLVPPFPDVVRSLQSSLAATLAVFTPLAGKLTPSSGGDDGDVFIDRSPGAVSPGVRFVEAEYRGGDMRRLARDAEHDTEAFLQLVPELEVGRLPAAVLAVQVTRAAGGGGVAIGVSIHHAVADGRSLWQFMRAWAAAARVGSPAAPGLVAPTFDRSVIRRHPKAEEVARKFVRLFAPSLPLVNTFPEPEWRRQSRRTYTLGADQIKSLKQRIQQQTENVPMETPTTYVAVSSLIWTSIVRAKSLNHADDCYLMFAADCRRRLHPAVVDDGFFGSCVKSCYAVATVGGLRGGDRGLARAAAEMQRAIREQLEDPLGDAERWVEINRRLPRERLAQVGSSHRFMAYETDFGWGKPRRVELVSVFSPEIAVLVGAAEDGAVQVSLALDRECIDAFEASFVSAS